MPVQLLSKVATSGHPNIRQETVMWFRVLQCYALLIALCLAGIASAQMPPPPGPPPGPAPAAQLAGELGLNAAQTSKLEAALNAERSAMEKLREERQRIHTSTREKLAAFLTAEQLKRFDEERARRPQFIPNGGPPQRQREPRGQPERKPQ
jgi:hypothetical protein